MTRIPTARRVGLRQFYAIVILVACSAAGPAQAQSSGYAYHSNTQPVFSAPQSVVAGSRAGYVGGNQPYYTAAQSGNVNYGPNNVNYGPAYAPGGGYESWPCTQPGNASQPQADSGGSPTGVWSNASGGACSGVASCQCTPSARWSGYAGSLFLFRDDENNHNFSFDSANEAFQLLDSQNSNFDFAPGVEAHLMRTDVCGNYGTEAVYWGVYPNEETAFAFPSQVTGNLNGILNFDQLDYNGNSANNNVNNAMVHRLRRNNEIHNAELNRVWFVSNGGGNSCCSTGCNAPQSLWSFQALVGLRYFRFEDDLEFGSDPVDTVFTGAVDELFYSIETENNLYGFQLGGSGERQLGYSGWSFTFGTKAGVFVNDADARSTIGGAAGLATINNGPNNGIPWDISSSDEDVATIAELQAGIAWRMSQTWRLRSDYRALGVTGVALPTNQIFPDLRGIQDVRLLSRNGSLFLHGVFIGVERTY